MLKLAFRNLFRHKLRTAITLMAVAFGVVMLILSGGFVEDMFVQLRESTIHSQLGHLQIYKAGYYAQGRRDPYHYLIQKPDVLERQLAELPHVARVMARLQFSGVLNNSQGERIRQRDQVGGGAGADR
jgi:putative ABC transport system permease protein